MNIKRILALSSVTLAILGLSCFDRMPRGVAVEDKTWNEMQRLMAENVERAYAMYGTEPYLDTLPVLVDYAVTIRSWMALVLSQRNDSVCRYGCYLGQMSYPNEFHYTHIQPATTVVLGTEFQRYLQLHDSDSLWLLFGEYNFWMSEESMEEIFWSDKTRQEGFEDYVAAYILSLPGSGHTDSTSFPSGEMAWGLDMGLLALREAENGLLAPETGKPLPSYVDFVAHHGSWFTCVLSSRDESGGQYMAIVGQHLGDSLVYRVLRGGTEEMTDTEYERYLELIDRDQVWTLVSIKDRIQSEDGLIGIWEQIGHRPDGADSATITSTFHLSAAFGE